MDQLLVADCCHQAPIALVQEWEAAEIAKLLAVQGKLEQVRAETGSSSPGRCERLWVAVFGLSRQRIEMGKLSTWTLALLPNGNQGCQGWCHAPVSQLSLSCSGVAALAVTML